MNMRLILQILLLMMSIEPSAALTFAVYALYTGSTCNGTPYAAYAFDEECTDGEELMSCSAYDESVGAENVGQWEVTCATDYIAKMREFFSNSHYILEVAFNDTSCSIFYAAYGVPASGNCEGSLNSTSEFYIIGSLNASGTTSIQYFNDSQCSDDSLYAMDSVDSTSLEHHTCNDGFIWSKDKHGGHYTTTLDASSLEAALSGQTGLWNDDVITAKRIPRDKVKIKKLI
ncbi:TKL protein kinase, partial [Phytophthora palmivora]